MKILKNICIALMLLLVGIIPIETNAVQLDSKESIKDYKILIDPGHGDWDGGAKTKNGTIEKDINLQISLKLRDALKKEGYDVYMTREEDTSLSNKKKDDLQLRCDKKKETKCDMFISIHQNMFTSSSSKGTQVWYSSDEKSKGLAESIQSAVKETLQPSNHRVAKDAKKSYKILRDGYEGANIIVECGFLSNHDDEKNLKDNSYQDKLVDSITKGINKYIEEKPEKTILE
ncbi:N-acetylmuramoyl-L-alanine amidase [Clostridium sardiniense]|uniref:N-acetylmuramoyl-L-alanine amidase n=1 Tax=Clostridium sardiniense TaxID=29369 RepID=UPI003D33B96A